MCSTCNCAKTQPTELTKVVPNARPVDFSKPLKHRNWPGTSAIRILATDLRGTYPVAVAYLTPGGSQSLARYTITGMHESGSPHLDLINAPVKVVKYANIYKIRNINCQETYRYFTQVHDTYEDAIRATKETLNFASAATLVATIPIEWEE